MKKSYPTSKKIGMVFVFIFFVLINVRSLAQVTIGEGISPESFSILQLESNGGLRLNQLDTIQRNMLSVSGNAKAEGLVIYNTNTKNMEIWNGSKWVNENIVPANGLSQFKDSVLLGGALSRSTNIDMKLNDFTLTGNGNVGIGTNSPTAKLHIKGTIRFDSLTQKNAVGSTDRLLRLDSDGYLYSAYNNISTLVGGYRPGNMNLKTIDINSSITLVRFIHHVDASNTQNNSQTAAYVYGDFTIIGIEGVGLKIVESHIKGYNGLPASGLVVTANSITWSAPSSFGGNVTINLNPTTGVLSIAQPLSIYSYVFDFMGGF